MTSPTCSLKVGHQICPLCTNLEQLEVLRKPSDYQMQIKTGHDMSRKAFSLVRTDKRWTHDLESASEFGKLLRSFVFISLITPSMIPHVTLVTQRRRSCSFLMSLQMSLVVWRSRLDTCSMLVAHWQNCHNGFWKSLEKTQSATLGGGWPIMSGLVNAVACNKYWVDLAVSKTFTLFVLLCSEGNPCRM